MRFHENHLLADDSHEISYLFYTFEKAEKLKWSSAANYRWRLMDEVKIGIHTIKNVIVSIFANTVGL